MRSPSVGGRTGCRGVLGHGARWHTARRQAGNIRAAPTRKQAAPSSVPPVATGLSISPPVLGRTKLAMADAMNKMEPTMLIQAIHHGNDRG